MIAREIYILYIDTGITEIVTPDRIYLPIKKNEFFCCPALAVHCRLNGIQQYAESPSSTLKFKKLLFQNIKVKLMDQDAGDIFNCKIKYKFRMPRPNFFIDDFDKLNNVKLEKRFVRCGVYDASFTHINSIESFKFDEIYKH